ncbi:MAG TPA: two-component regulator propeller domain-containing protein [Edaphobacter sp.]|nr:two-component regulator propeller domain-containing protein [Edaphobacter sp.]
MWAPRFGVPLLACSFDSGIVQVAQLWIWVCLLLSATAWSQQTAPASFSRRVWLIQDGLPEDTVQAFALTHDGYLWAGTTGGLVRFDGHHFYLFSRDTTPALPENSVFCLSTGRDGALWIGTEGGGLAVLRNGSIKRYSAAEGLTDGFVRAVHEDAQGRLWVGTDDGIFLMKNEHLSRLDTSHFAAHFAVHALAEDTAHRIWAGGSELLVFSGHDDTPKIEQYGLPGAYSQNRVKAILSAHDGSMWVGTVGGLEHLEHGHFRVVSQIRGTVRTLREADDGSLWIGTIGEGLWSYKDGEYRLMSRDSVLPSKTVLSLFEDSLQQIWVGTQNGMVRLSRTPVAAIPLPGASDPDFETISYDSDGTVWVASSRVYRIRNGVAEPYHFDAIGNAVVRNVFRDRAGTLWIGTDGDGVYHLMPGRTVHYSAPRELTNNFIRAFLQTANGDIWIGTDEGVARINGSGVHTYQVQDGLVYFSIRSLLEDRNHDVWIGTEQGLSHWHHGAFQHDEVTNALRSEKIWTMHQDQDGGLWFGTRDHGLFHFRNGNLSHYTRSQGLASNSVYQILEDHTGTLWLSGPDTISSLNRVEIDSRPSPSAHLSVTVYEMPYAAEGAQMYGGRQPAGSLDIQGGAWFASTRGALHVYPQRAVQRKPPKLLVDSVSVEGRPMPLTVPLRLPAGASRMEIGFAALLLRSQEDVRLRYKLEPLDQDWTFAGATRTATYTNLPAGSYHFRVQAFETSDPSLTTEATLEFGKLPHFYQTRWFLTLACMVVVAIGWAIYRSRVRQLRLRFDAVLTERARLAREMHDTLIQGCIGVSALLEAVASQPNERPALSDALLVEARTQVRSTIQEAREAIWNLRHGDGPGHDLLASLSSIALQTERDFGVPLQLIREGQEFTVRESVAYELLMVVREALYNAITHGRPERIGILLHYGRELLRIEVKDDGLGFDPAARVFDADKHYGLTGMRERMERLGGVLRIASAPQGGTCVALSVACAGLAAHRGKQTV